MSLIRKGVRAEIYRHLDGCSQSALLKRIKMEYQTCLGAFVSSLCMVGFTDLLV